MAKSAPAKKKALTKSAVLAELAEASGLKKTEVSAVIEAFTKMIADQLSGKGPGIVTLPGVARFKARRVKASKGGEKKPNPLKPGEFFITKDKPAYTKVTISAVKSLKESVM